MAKPRQIRLAAINIKTDLPHAPNNYIDLFNMLISRSSIPYGVMRGDNCIELFTYTKESDLLLGTFVTYIKIDNSRPWFDREQRKQLIDEDGRPIAQVRESVGANSEFISFVFDVSCHRLFVEIRRYSPQSIANGLTALFNQEEINQRYGEIHVVVEPEIDVIDKIIAIPNKHKIDIYINIPNSDVPSDLEELIVSGMKSTNTQKKYIRYIAPKKSTLQTDDTMKAEMRIAGSNGHVSVTAKDARDKTFTKSTKKYPLTRTVPYYEPSQYKDSFVNLALSIKQEIARTDTDERD